MFQKLLDDQYRLPKGLLGRWIGSQMARDHLPENLWTVALLAAQPTDAILEIGFGAGIAIQALTRKITQGRIAGVDFSTTMVSAARRRNASAVKSGLVDLRYGDAAVLPFPDESFDKVFSIHSIYFWPRPQIVLHEVRRVLKPGGMIVLTILPKERWNEQDPNAPVGTPDCTPYSGTELIEMLSVAGFQAPRLHRDANLTLRSNYSAIAFK